MFAFADGHCALSDNTGGVACAVDVDDDTDDDDNDDDGTPDRGGAGLALGTLTILGDPVAAWLFGDSISATIGAEPLRRWPGVNMGALGTRPSLVPAGDPSLGCKDRLDARVGVAGPVSVTTSHHVQRRNTPAPHFLSIFSQPIQKKPGKLLPTGGKAAEETVLGKEGSGAAVMQCAFAIARLGRRRRKYGTQLGVQVPHLSFQIDFLL
jgi:hypothetical protein